MIVNSGKTKLLDAQNTYWAGVLWALFTNNVAVSSVTVWTDLVEAAWSGYARVAVGSLLPSVIVSGKASAQPVAQPAFGNSSGSTQNFYGWALVDPSGPTLIAAVNVGATSIITGSTFPISAVFTDDQA